MSKSDLENRIDEWLNQNARWEEDPFSHGLREARDDNGNVYYPVEVRFLNDNSKSNLQQKFTDKLENKVAWYRLGYHGCTHRDGDGSSGPCSWDDVVEWSDKDVAIPSGIPDIQVA